MKTEIKLLLILFVFVLNSSLIAQTDSTLSKQINSAHPTKIESNKWEQKTIFKSHGSENGRYGALSIKYGTVDKSNTTFVGGKYSWVVDHKLAIGFGGYGLYSQKQSITKDIEFNYAGGYGGFIIEPIFYSDKTIHLSMPILLGGGWVGRIQNVNGDNQIMYYDLVFLTVEPGLEINLNVTKRFLIAFGAYYTIANDIDSSSELSDQIMNNLSVGMQFKWGLF